MANAEARLAALEQALTAVAGRRRIIREVPKPSKFRNYYDFFRAFKRYAQGQTDIVSDQKESLYLILQTDQDKIRINSAEGMLDNPGIGYDAFSDHLLTMFCPASESNMAKSEYLDKRQGSTESIQGYMADKRSLFDRAYAPGTPGRDEQQFVKNVALGLYHPNLRNMACQWIHVLSFANYDEMIINFTSGFRLLVENKLGEDTSSLGLYSSTGRPPITTPLPGTQYPEQMEIDVPQSGACHHCQQSGHFKSECPRLMQGGRSNSSNRPSRPSAAGAEKKKKGDCNRCLHPGHWQRDCQIPEHKLAAAKARNAANKKKGKVAGGRAQAAQPQPSTSSQRPNIRLMEADANTVDQSYLELIQLLRNTDIGSMAPVESLENSQDFPQGSRKQ